jgi:hypothetical protein
MFACHDRHGGGDAGRVSGGDQVGGRERRAAPLIIARGIGDEIVAGRFVFGGAMQLALVSAGDFDHAAIFPPAAAPRRAGIEAVDI